MIVRILSKCHILGRGGGEEGGGRGEGEKCISRDVATSVHKLIRHIAL